MSIRFHRAGDQHQSPNSHKGSDWHALLHPAGAFSRPSDVVRDPDLTLNEKRESSRRGPPMPAPSSQRQYCEFLRAVGHR